MLQFFGPVVCLILRTVKKGEGSGKTL